MNTLFVGKNLLELSEVDSTNAFASQLLPGKPVEGTVIMAAYQSAGKGQQTNTWLSEANANLTFSLILYPRFLRPDRAFSLNKVISLALKNGLQELLPDTEVQIKWPNDILVQRKKIAGILIENHLNQHGIKASIIGIGLNVNQIKFPGELGSKATSLSLEAGRQFDLKSVFEKLMVHLEPLFLQLRTGNTNRIDYEYLQALYGYGEHIHVRILNPATVQDLPGKPIEKEVILVGVAPEGRLALQVSNQLHYFNHKEVEFLL